MCPSWTHDSLAADLLDARHLAGEIAMERLAIRGGILDVAAMRLSWTRPVLTGYEIKVSRSDLLADLRANKWRNYLPGVQRLYFCLAPEVVCEPEEIPLEAGIMRRSTRHSWRTIRKPYCRVITPERHAGFIQALLFRHYPAPWDGTARARANVRRLLEAPASVSTP